MPQEWCHITVTCAILPTLLLRTQLLYLFVLQIYKADAVLHFGMHGTVEWLPGSPLGNTGREETVLKGGSCAGLLCGKASCAVLARLPLSNQVNCCGTVQNSA